MLAIKFQRVGKKHQPSYRVVVAEKRSKMIAPPVEDLGAYNPMTKKATLKRERVAYWVSKGAQPTVTVHNLLVKEGILNLPKIKLVFKQNAVAAANAPAAPAAPASAPEAAETPEAAG